MEGMRIRLEDAEGRIRSLEQHVTLLDESFGAREFGCQIEDLIRKEVIRDSGVRISTLRQVANMLTCTKTDGVHAKLKAAHAQAVQTHSWLADLEYIHPLLQHSKVSAGAYAHQERPLNAQHQVERLAARVKTEDERVFPTKDAFAAWLESTLPTAFPQQNNKEEPEKKD